MISSQASYANSQRCHNTHLYSENVFDIETIFRKVESFPGVKNAEVVQPFDIRWPQDWSIKEIDQRLKKEEKSTADVV